jgi:putative transposase
MYLKWNKHNWREHHNPTFIAVETMVDEEYTNQSTAPSGNVALGEAQDD